MAGRGSPHRPEESSTPEQGSQNTSHVRGPSTHLVEAVTTEPLLQTCKESMPHLIAAEAARQKRVRPTPGYIERYRLWILCRTYIQWPKSFLDWGLYPRKFAPQRYTIPAVHCTIMCQISKDLWLDAYSQTSASNKTLCFGAASGYVPRSRAAISLT